MKPILLAISAAVLTGLFVLPLAAGDITVSDAYMRSTTPSSKTGAAFLVLTNNGATDDRLIGAETDVAARAELHTHRTSADGMMQMMEIEGGIPLPAGATHALARGGDHIMLTGLTRPLEQGEAVTVTLIFEKAGAVEIVMPVDRKRRPDHGKAGHDG